MSSNVGVPTLNTARDKGKRWPKPSCRTVATSYCSPLRFSSFCRETLRSSTFPVGFICYMRSLLLTTSLSQLTTSN